jgi:hypothetical protein
MVIISIISSLKETSLGTILLSYLVSDLKKISSVEIECTAVFKVYGLCFCDLLFEEKNFGHSSNTYTFCLSLWPERFPKA